MPENAIFISYAREDLPAVQRLKSALDAAGLVTWFDLDRLEGGDDYDRKIRANIGRCSFFLPVISGTTQRRLEAYFRREWSYAVDRSRNIAEGAVFILPVCIDDTAEADAQVPEKFRAVHISRLPGGRAVAGVHPPAAGTVERAPLMSSRVPELSTEVRVDPENPWIGLSSYDEDTRAYFHGRDDEAAELARRVQRKQLTILFGQSGLGKTSLLRAGLVPRLRGEGFCPVYVRVDYSPDTPSPAEQIKQAIFKVTAEAGHWTRAGSAVEGESLWEFLHHRGDLLRDRDGKPLLPLLIFDQFEEIFTLAQADDAGRRRAQEFIEELADLVENRPPHALERRLENDDAAADDFDFARADYRILISLREDYLAHLESVKGVMPSITQNRMRLARMTGAQALTAVLKPGGRLVSQEVAESIVRFVAGGSELQNAEVEPSLLSLICRELNTVRQSQGKAEISADLLAGSRDTILSEFYERALADQPAGVRRVIEDELLTESGYRESLAEERVAKALLAAGAAPDALAKLVDRRLLRIEERLDMRRVELTHDVLCSVVRASRNLRQEREARDEAERQLARAAGKGGRNPAHAAEDPPLRHDRRGPDAGGAGQRGVRLGQLESRPGGRPAGAAGARRRREARRLPDRGFLRRARTHRPARDHGQARAHGGQLLRRPAQRTADAADTDLPRHGAGPRSGCAGVERRHRRGESEARRGLVHLRPAAPGRRHQRGGGGRTRAGQVRALLQLGRHRCAGLEGQRPAGHRRPAAAMDRARGHLAADEDAVRGRAQLPVAYDARRRENRHCRGRAQDPARTGCA